MRVLITGAGGFIGSHLTELLAKENKKVTAFIRYNSSGNIGNLKYVDKKLFKNIEIVFGDLRAREQIEEISKKTDMIVHLAANISVKRSFENPEEVVINNILSTLNILEALKKSKVPLLYVSTSEVYGNPDKMPIRENITKKALSPYAASKIATDELVRSICSYFEIPFLILRPFNTFGERQSIRSVIPWIIYQILNSREIKLGNIDTKRDFLYVKDTIKAMKIAIDEDIFNGEEINICSGNSVSIKTIIQKLLKISGKNMNIKIVKSRKRKRENEIMELRGSNKKANEILSFKPSYTLEQGLERTFEFYKKYGFESLPEFSLE